MRISGSAVLFAAAGMIGCAAPHKQVVTHASSAPLPHSDLTIEAPGAAPAIVQVYEYRRSPTVTILAWAPEESAYGLRAWIRRDGSLVRDHRFYVSTWYDGGTFTYIGGSHIRRGFFETVAPAARLLEPTGLFRDAHSCHAWPECSPYATRGARVPDAMLRANRDSVSIRLYGRGGAELIVTIRRDVIDPYLRAVDSVSAALRKSY